MVTGQRRRMTARTQARPAPLTAAPGTGQPGPVPLPRSGPGPSPGAGPGPSRRRPHWQAFWPWFILWPWSAAWAAWHLHGAGQSWHFFASGGRLLLSGGPGGGLHLYAAHPQLQIGPLTLTISGALESLGPWPSRVAAIAAMSATGPPLLAAVWALAPRAGRRRSQLLLAGLVFLPVWTEVTTQFAHLDDLLALSFSVAAAHAVARRHPVLAGLALAAAADSKPWAAAFVPMLLVLPRPQRWAALGVFAGGVTAAWLPFVLADPHSLMAAQFTIPNDHSSALRVLGVNAARTPWWDRPAQLALGMAGGCLAVWRRRWPAVILLAVSARILLDPGVYSYYTSGALLGTVLVDLVVTRWRLPWATATGAALLYAARFTSEVYPFTLHELGVLRAVFAVGMPALVLGVPGWLMARRPGRHARGSAGQASEASASGTSGNGAGADPQPWPALQPLPVTTRHWPGPAPLPQARAPQPWAAAQASGTAHAHSTPDAQSTPDTWTTPDVWTTPNAQTTPDAWTSAGAWTAAQADVTAQAGFPRGRPTPLPRRPAGAARRAAPERARPAPAVTSGRLERTSAVRPPPVSQQAGDRR